MGINYGDVMYDNVMRDATPVYSATDIPAYAVANLFDWLNYSLFQPQNLATIDVTVPAGRTLTDVTYWVATPTVSSYFELYYESAPSTFTLLGTFGLDTAGIRTYPFSSVTVSAGRRVRVKFYGVGTTTFMRQLFVGTKLTFPAGEWVDKTPHALQSGFVVENVISMNGSIIGRNIRRVEKSGKIELEHLTESWVRNYWEPFVTHATRLPFFYRWNPTDYSQDVIFAAADSIVPPMNMSPPPLMKVSMPFKGRTS